MDEREVAAFAVQYVKRETGYMVQVVDVTYTGPDRWRVRVVTNGAPLAWRVVVDTDQGAPRARIIR